MGAKNMCYDIKEKFITGFYILLILLIILLPIIIGGYSYYNENIRGNKTAWDTQYTFNKAIVILNDGTKMEIEIEKWKDFDGEQIQIQGKDGKVYLVSSYNTILVKDK